MKKLQIKTKVIIVLDALALIGFFVFYGPFDIIRSWWVTTSLNTMTHQYLAWTFYNEEMINDIKSKNYIIPLTDEVDLSKIVVDPSEKTTFENIYEEEILKRNNPNDTYKKIDISIGNKYTGHLVAIYDPSKVKVITKEKFNTGSEGERIATMCKRYNGTVCMTGGGSLTKDSIIVDNPAGVVIEDSKIKNTGSEYAKIIGFNKENKLVLTTTNATKAIEMGIRDAVEFGPFLIINGKSMQSLGNGGYGRAARAAIGQRRDGVVLFLVVNACDTFYCGATLDEIVKVFEKYGAYNAANLDGGASTSLVINGKLVNKVMNMSNEEFKIGRALTTGFGFIEK